MVSIEERVKKIVQEQLGCKKEDILNSSSFVENLGSDSLAMVEIFLAFEEEFQIEIPDEDMNNLRTVQSVIDYINKNNK